ncbi:hypothetical protein ACIBTV_27235 [Micromonospora sp. NPDC049366]|uniref:hypothetical protein n=1 Tax=Micromonospora sp. NPDC049366 TaxID=3364271 RepID=UPI00379253C8
MARQRSAYPLKTFEKDGKERAAYSPADAVALRFDGWTEKPAAKPARQPDATPAQKQQAAGGGSSK